jgi:hypothetical protein
VKSDRFFSLELVFPAFSESFQKPPEISHRSELRQFLGAILSALLALRECREQKGFSD